jgi:hypothetical protein
VYVVEGFRTASDQPITTAPAAAINGVIISATNMAPITTAAESDSNPAVAMMVDNTSNTLMRTKVFTDIESHSLVLSGNFVHHSILILTGPDQLICTWESDWHGHLESDDWQKLKKQ